MTDVSVHSTSSAPVPDPALPPVLPYGPAVTRTLPVLDRTFRFLNRYYALPAIKAGLGPLHANPLTGSLMLLRTTGRTSGRPREVALGRSFVCAPDASRDELLAKTANLPLIRIRPVGIAAGPADPGGWLWVSLTVVGLVWLVGRIRDTRRR